MTVYVKQYIDILMNIMSGTYIGGFQGETVKITKERSWSRDSFVTGHKTNTKKRENLYVYLFYYFTHSISRRRI